LDAADAAQVEGDGAQLVVADGGRGLVGGGSDRPALLGPALEHGAACAQDEELGAYGVVAAGLDEGQGTLDERGPSAAPAWPAMRAGSARTRASPTWSSAGHSATASCATARARPVRVAPRSDSATVRSSSWWGRPATASGSGTCSQSSRARSPRAT